MGRRVVVTGIGVIAPGAIGKEQLWERVKSGQSSVEKVRRFDASSLPTQIAAEANDFDPSDYVDRKASRRLDRYAQLAVSAAQMASQDAHLSVDKEAKDCVGVFEGTSLGPLKATLDQHEQYLSEGCRRVNPSTLLTSMMGAGSSSIALHLQTHGPSLTISDGSASSAYAIGYGYRQIKDGYIDVALVGGAEAPISQEVFATFCCARLLSTCNNDPHRAMRPFDRDRNGFVLGEGAAFLVIEDLSHALKRNAAVYAELAGFGETTDAYHPASPHPEGIWIARAMEMALKEAGLKSEEVDYLNAHGTATHANDGLKHWRSNICLAYTRMTSLSVQPNRLRAICSERAAVWKQQSRSLR